MSNDERDELKKARLEVLKMIAHATNQNNSSSVKMLAEAYSVLVNAEVSVDTKPTKPEPTSTPSGGVQRHE